MTDLLLQALRAARQPDALPPLRQSLLVLGAGGALGSAVLAEALVAGRFREVSAWVAAPLASTLRGLRPVTREALAQAEGPRFDAAVLVFDRARSANGRDEAFEMPDPGELLPLARQLQARGVRHLVLLMPHAPALLPQALAAGLATLDETALAALGFEHLVILRAARPGPSDPGVAGWLARFAGWWLSQLRYMVPERQQPLRTAGLARCVAELLMALPETEPGTRVVAPETLWAWVRERDAVAPPAPDPGR